MDQLFQTLYDLLVGTDLPSPPPVAPNLRQKLALERAQKALIKALHNLERQESPEIVAMDIREALDCLGEITGETTTEEVIDHIFNRFCIGK